MNKTKTWAIIFAICSVLTAVSVFMILGQLIMFIPLYYVLAVAIMLGLMAFVNIFTTAFTGGLSVKAPFRASMIMEGIYLLLFVISIIKDIFIDSAQSFYLSGIITFIILIICIPSWVAILIWCIAFKKRTLAKLG